MNHEQSLRCRGGFKKPLSVPEGLLRRGDCYFADGQDSKIIIEQKDIGYNLSTPTVPEFKGILIRNQLPNRTLVPRYLHNCIMLQCKEKCKIIQSGCRERRIYDAEYCCLRC